MNKEIRTLSADKKQLADINHFKEELVKYCEHYATIKDEPGTFFTEFEAYNTRMAAIGRIWTRAHKDPDIGDKITEAVDEYLTTLLSANNKSDIMIFEYTEAAEKFTMEYMNHKQIVDDTCKEGGAV